MAWRWTRYQGFKPLTSDPTTPSHSIMISTLTNDAHQYIIPLQLEGVVRYFEYTLPTSAEYKDDDISHLELMAGSLTWDPYCNDFALQEESHLDFRGHLISAARSDCPCSITNTWTICLMPLTCMMTIIWAWPWMSLCRCPWWRPAYPQRCMMCVMSKRVNARGLWTTPLWPMAGKFHSTKHGPWCNIPHNGASILSRIPLF